MGVEDCTGRRGGGLGSSKGYAPGGTAGDVGGVMALNSTTNPDFHSWTMVCRSSSPKTTLNSIFLRFLYELKRTF